jgi:hypothetical protein
MNKKHNKSYRSLKRMRQYISKTKRIQRSNKNKKSSLANGHNNKTKVVEKRRRLRHIVQRGGIWNPFSSCRSCRPTYRIPEGWSMIPESSPNGIPEYVAPATFRTIKSEYTWVKNPLSAGGHNYGNNTNNSLEPISYPYSYILEYNHIHNNTQPDIFVLSNFKFDLRVRNNMTMTAMPRSDGVVIDLTPIQIYCVRNEDIRNMNHGRLTVGEVLAAAAAAM